MAENKIWYNMVLNTQKMQDNQQNRNIKMGKQGKRGIKGAKKEMPDAQTDQIDEGLYLMTCQQPFQQFLVADDTTGIGAPGSALIPPAAYAVWDMARKATA